jgi:hypothetical protein
VNATRPHFHQQTVDAGRWPTLYRQPGILVTGEAFTIAGRRFPIRDLSNLRTARGPHDRLTMRSVLIAAGALAVVGLALGATGDFTDRSPMVYLVLGAAAFVPIALVALGRRLRPRPWELWGDFRGMTVLLFSSDEERQYGQVTRAIMRAQEAERLGGVAEPVASTYYW